MNTQIGIGRNGLPFIQISDGAPDESPAPAARAGKGKSLIEFPDSYTAIDIETTGLDPSYCYIIEVAAVKYRDGQIADSFSTLVKPLREIDDYIADLTGITNDMVKDAPAPADALRAFCDFVGTDILIGYNVSFDVNFLYDNVKNYLETIFSNSFVDVLRIARRTLRGMEHYNLASVAEALDIPVAIAHRAQADCETCASVFEALKVRIIADGDSLEDFAVRASRSSVRAADIKASNSEFDETHPLFGKTCVFTGVLERMVRRDAMQLVVDLGGSVGDSVTKKTDYLILGNNDFCSSIKGGKSSKQKKAEALILGGSDLKILSENVFYDLVLDD